MSARKGIMVEIEGLGTAFTINEDTLAPVNYSQPSIEEALVGVPNSQNMSVNPFDGTFETGGISILFNRMAAWITERTTTPITTLTAAMGAGDNFAPVVSTADFAASGVVWIGREACLYSSKNAANFLGLTRGAYGTTAAAHAETTGDTATVARKVYGFNPFLKGRKVWITWYDLDDPTDETQTYIGFVDGVAFTDEGFSMGLLNGAKFLADSEVMGGRYVTAQFLGAWSVRDGVQRYGDMERRDDPQGLTVALDDDNFPFPDPTDADRGAGAYFQSGNEFIFYAQIKSVSGVADAVGAAGGKSFFESDKFFEEGDYVTYVDVAIDRQDALIIEAASGVGALYRYYHSGITNPAAGNTVTAPYRQDLWIPRRAQQGTLRELHKVGDAVKEVRILQDDHVDCVLRLLLSGETSPSTSFDNLPDAWGAGLHEDFVDLESFKKLYDYSTDRRFVFTEPKKPLALLATLALATGSRIFWAEDGKLTVNVERDLYPDSEGANSVTVEDDIVSIPGWDDRQDAIYNVWVWRGNTGEGGKESSSEYQDEAVFQVEDSIEFYGKRHLPDLEDSSLVFTNHANHMELVATAVLNRWSPGCPYLDLDILHIEDEVYQPGTLVNVTIAHLPDQEGGGGLTTALYEVLEYTPNDGEGTDHIRLVAMPPESNTALIAPCLEVKTNADPDITMEASSVTHFADAVNGNTVVGDAISGENGKEDVDFFAISDEITFWDVSTLGNTPPTTVDATITGIDYGTRVLTFSAIPAWLAAGDIVRLRDWDNAVAADRTWFIGLADETQDPPDLGASDDANVWGL